MKKSITKFVALASMVLLIIPSVLFLAGQMGLEKVKFLMLIATVIWFVAAAVGMWNNSKIQNDK